MNTKRTGWAFLLLIVVHLLVVLLINVLNYQGISTAQIGLVGDLLLSEAIMFVPIVSIAYVFWRRQRKQSAGQVGFLTVLGFRKVKATTLLMTVLFTFLVMPTATLCNAISMLFVENTMTGMAGDMMNVPFFLLLFIMAMFGPMCEEIAFRGIVYPGLRRSGNVLKSILLGGILFGLMHLNVNQALYASALGIMLCFLAEAAGSLWPAFVCHMIFNGESVCLMYLSNWIMSEDFSDVLEESGEIVQQADLAMVIALYLLIAVIGLGLAFPVLHRISENEGRGRTLRLLWETRKVPAKKLVTWPLAIGIVLSLIYMIGMEILIRMTI